MASFLTDMKSLLGDRRRLRSFVVDSKCVPWRARAFFKRRFLVAYRILRYGRLNINTAAHWDEIWGREGLGTWRQYPERFARIANLVPVGARVLDVGCGVGVLLRRLRRDAHCEVFGIDISLSAIRTLKGIGVHGAVGVVPQLPVATAAFDVVTATELLEHVDDPLATLLELARCLRPGGLLIVTTPDNALAPWEEDHHMQVFVRDTLDSMASCVLKEFQVESLQEHWSRNGETITENILFLHGRTEAL